VNETPSMGSATGHPDPLCEGDDDPRCECWSPVPEEQPGPTDQDICERDGHPYYADAYPDEPTSQGGSCYCGKATYPTGGPS